MKLKSGMQNAAVKRVLDHSYPIGDRIIVFGDPGSDIFTYDVAALKTIATPMQREILDQVAWDALVAAADQCGYDGEGDIAARLLDPTEFSTYAKPLIAYVSILSPFKYSQLIYIFLQIFSPSVSLSRCRPEGVGPSR